MSYFIQARRILGTKRVANELSLTQLANLLTASGLVGGGGGGGAALEVQEEGTPVDSAVDTMDFIGRMTVTSPGAGAVDVTLTDADIATGYNTQVAQVSQAEAEAGTVTADRRWTPERVGQAIAALAPGSEFLSQENITQWDLIHVRDEKSDGSSGGTATATTTHTRDLNTVITNDIPGASLASNQITLPPGEYYCEANAPARAVDNHRLWLYDTTGSAYILAGGNTLARSSADAECRAHISGLFTLSVESDIELRHYCQTGATTFGLGSGDGVARGNEVFAQVRIWKKRTAVVGGGRGGGGSYTRWNIGHWRDEKSDTTAGGTFTAGAWQTRDLNTEVKNDIAGASLASNQITLPAGTYRILAFAPALQVNGHRAKLYDVTGAADLLLGTSERSNNGANTSTRSVIEGQFTLAVESDLEIRHYAATTNPTFGFGSDSPDTGVNVYTEVVILQQEQVNLPDPARQAGLFYGAVVDNSGSEVVTGSTTVRLGFWDTEITQSKINGLSFFLGADFTFVDGDVNTTDDTITETGHGMATGDGPFFFTNSGGALPTGLAASTKYWCIRVDEDTFKVATSYGNAVAGTAVDITAAAGGGTHTCDRQGRLVVPSGQGITYIRLSAGVRSNQDNCQMTFTRDGASFDGTPFIGASAATDAHPTRYIGQSIIPVTDGEYYEVQVRNISNQTYVANDNSFFTIEAVTYDQVQSFVLKEKTAYWRDEKTSGTQGGSFSSGSWVTRDLNTEVHNDITGASLASNQFTLPAGKYRIWARAPGLDINSHKAKLRDTTGAADLIIGSNSWTSTSDSVQTDSIVEGEFTLTTTSVLELQHRCSANNLTNGLGSSNSFSVVEVYAEVFIEQVEAQQAELVVGTGHWREEQTSGTNGGGSTASTQNTRTLNTEVTNTIPGASLASNQITLPAGTYEIDAHAPAFRTDAHKLRLRNTTDSSTALVGASSHSHNTNQGPSGTHAFLKGRFSITAEKVFELQHYTAQTQGTNGLGVATSSGDTEVYSEVIIRKIST